VPELDFSYFFTDNIAAELILAVAKHHADVKGSTVGAQVDVGSAYVVPPTLTLQYHFTNFETFKPYIGAGLNYTMYFNEDPGSQTSLDLKNSFGYAFQAGVDVPIDKRWGVNFDVKKIYTNADGSWNGGGIRGDIDLDPWVVGAGISYRF
ncbi:MAG: outer membrane beta-barrel protein, partial [Rickettsiales bacterium]|nr:outer membrane beta-barrel protein [Rickettsiales bacterium]